MTWCKAFRERGMRREEWILRNVDMGDLISEMNWKLFGEGSEDYLDSTEYDS
jgi:hypothetical protein